jgi:adhesin transport system membrane fusion protein
MVDFRKSPRLAELEYMTPKVAATSTETHRFAVITFGVIGTLFILFIIWASFSTISVITNGHGKVIPSQKIQLISHLEGGIIQNVLVREGELVNAGQVLMRLDPNVAQAREKSKREEYLRYLAAADRLQAQIDDKDYTVPDIVKRESPLIAEAEMTHYRERIQQIATQKSIAEQVVIQKRQELEEEKARLTQAETQYELSTKEVKMVSPLVAEQLISKREILRLERDTANLKGEIAKSKASLPKIQAALEQAQFELKQVETRFQNEDLEVLRDVKLKLAEAKGLMFETQDRLNRAEIISPVKGIVKEIKVKTPGGVIRPGEEVMEIVPLDDTLIVEVMVLPSDVAFLHPDQEASVKIAAYDFSIYGSLKGRLIEISPDTVHDQELRKDFYRVKVITDKNYLEHNGKKLPIIPGMTADVDILTGDRTIMQYLLKPILKGAQESFRER